MADQRLQEPDCHADLPRWYVDRYNEDGDTIWLPVFYRTWEFIDHPKRTVDTRPVVGQRTRGQARAFASKEWGEPFTKFRARKVWLRARPATFDEEVEHGPFVDGDLTEECAKGDEGAWPHWRLDFVGSW